MSIVSRAEPGTSLRDNRAVGNSRLAHREVLSVSRKEVPGSALTLNA